MQKAAPACSSVRRGSAQHAGPIRHPRRNRRAHRRRIGAPSCVRTGRAGTQPTGRTYDAGTTRPVSSSAPCGARRVLRTRGSWGSDVRSTQGFPGTTPQRDAPFSTKPHGEASPGGTGLNKRQHLPKRFRPACPEGPPRPPVLGSVPVIGGPGGFPEGQALLRPHLPMGTDVGEWTPTGFIHTCHRCQ